MKYKNTFILAVIIVIVIILGIIILLHFSPKVYSIKPCSNERQHWKIAYYEGGSFIDYSLSLRGLAKGLTDLGWIEPIIIPDFSDKDNAQLIWEFLAHNCKSNFITFSENAFWTANWKDSTCVINRRNAIEYLNKNTIDLVLALGAWAGQDLVNNEHTTATMVITSGGPLRAGIIKSADDSGCEHIFVGCDPNSYKKQIELFHDIIGFERLGVMFEDSEDGRIYAHYAELEKVSQKRDFKLIVCHADEGDTKLESFENAKRSYQVLAPIVDAMWVGIHQGESVEFLPELLKPMCDFNVPTWGVLGEPAVEKGVLLSITHQNFDEIGRWYAENIAKIFNGAKPRELSQIFKEENHILINTETARRIEYEIPETLLEIADKIYKKNQS